MNSTYGTCHPVTVTGVTWGGPVLQIIMMA
jgi:hypothetical protein